MRVLQVIPGISPRFGGPSVALTDMTRLLCERGADTVIFTTNADPEGRMNAPLGGAVEVRGARIFYHNIWPVNRWAFSLTLLRTLLRQTRQYDVVHIHWLFNFSSLAAAIAAKRSGVPFLFQPNGSLDPNLMRRNRWVKKIYIRLFASFILKNAAGIIYASEGERDLAQSQPGLAPGYVVPVGLDWKDYANLPAKGAFRKQFPELSGKRIILFLSRISRQKGMDLLIQAFRIVAAKHPDAHLVLAGPDGEGYGSLVKTWIEEARLTPRVTWAGRVPDGLKTAAYLDSEMFVLPSYAENFGAVVTEAMACGRPVIISDRVNICREIKLSDAGIVTPCVAEAVAEGMLQLLDNPALAQAMGEKGRELVQAKFTWDVALASLIPLYQQVSRVFSPSPSHA